MLKKMGIRQRPFYNTRHTYISYMLELSGKPLFVARQTGTSLEMIERHFGQVSVLADELDEMIDERAKARNPTGTPQALPLTRIPGLT